MKLGLILSNDWEVFGDGSGDYFAIQHQPLLRMLEVLDEFGAKMTVMAEWGQQFAHRSVRSRESWAARITAAWEDALRMTVRVGSDVQLHLHPQWLKARWQDGAWRLSMDSQVTGHLPFDTVLEVLVEGKRYLEGLLRPEDPTYACIAYRAGGYCIEPSEHVVRALTQAGFLCDSSVIPGMAEPGLYDYSGVPPALEPWRIGKTVTQVTAESDGLLEIPIYSVRRFDSPLLRKLLSPKVFFLLSMGVLISKEDAAWSGRRNRLMLERYPLRRRGLINKGLSLRRILKKVLTWGAIHLDYDTLPAPVFTCLVRRALREQERLGVGVLPLMAIGHVKGMPDCENLRRILFALKKEFSNEVEFWTLRQAIARMNQKSNLVHA